RPAPAGMDAHKEAFRVQLVDVSDCLRVMSGHPGGLNPQCSNRCSNRAEDPRLSPTDVRGRPAGSHLAEPEMTQPPRLKIGRSAVRPRPWPPVPNWSNGVLR